MSNKGDYEDFYTEDKPMKSKRKIFVIGGSNNYANWMQGTIVQNPDEADLIVFSGGEDVNPAMYGEKCGKYTSFSKRDELEKWFFDKYVRKVPMWGTCRGLQIGTVFAGGKLIQDVNFHTGANHDVYVGYIPKSEEFGTLYEITTCHHQMCYPFNLPKEDYVVIGKSSPALSNTYTNGDNKEIVLPENFCEPEILFYPKIRFLGVQGHPEFSSCPQDTIKYLQDLLDEFMDGTLYEKCKVSTNEEVIIAEEA